MKKGHLFNCSKQIVIAIAQNRVFLKKVVVL